MLTIGADEVDRSLSFPLLVAALRQAFRRGVVQPPRHHHAVERSGTAGATLLLMPAWSEFGGLAVDDNGFIGVKVVTIAPGNNALRKPAVMGVYLLLDGRTGEPLALIDGQRLTLWRTAAASALAADYLARRDAASLLIVGAGALSPFLARAHASVRPIRQVRIWNRTRANAETVANGLAAEGLDAGAVDDLAAAVGQADIVSCATISPTPLVQGAWLKAGTHLDLVGAFTPMMRETDDEAIRRATVYVDTLAGATTEAGDIVQPLRSGVLKAEDIAGDLAALARGKAAGRSSGSWGEEQITLFKSVGAALEDLAAGMLVHQRFTGARTG